MYCTLAERRYLTILKFSPHTQLNNTSYNRLLSWYIVHTVITFKSVPCQNLKNS